MKENWNPFDRLRWESITTQFQGNEEIIFKLMQFILKN